MLSFLAALMLLLPAHAQAEARASASFTLTEAMDRAFHQSFDSRAQYERQIQARLTAKAAYLNLLPHLSLSSILATASPSVGGLLGVVGDLAPFLLPTRWFQARNARLLSAAEFQASALMRADAAAQVEGLAYALARDRAISARYADLLSIATETRDKLQQIEAAGQMPEGSTDHLNATLNSGQFDLSSLQELTRQDRATLAQAMGFVSPEAVADVAIDGESLPIDFAKPLDTDPTIQAALARSYELKEMDQLIAVARNQKRELYFNWLDPAGDYNAPLGFGLSATVAVGRSRVRELEVRRQQIAAAVSQKVAQAVALFNQALSDYRLVTEGLYLQDRRLKRVLSQIGPGSSLNTLDIQSVFADAIISAIRFESVIANFRVARSLIDRSLLQGRYASLR